MEDKKLQSKLNELVKNADVMIASPETIAILRKKVVGIKSKSETYKEYLDKLFKEKRSTSFDLLDQLPALDPAIANPTAGALYEEIRQCAVMGIPGATITQVVILLEFAARHRVWEKRLESDSNARWEDTELLDLGSCAMELKKKAVISKAEWKKLKSFNEDVRNPYLHYNIKKLLEIERLTLKELPTINVHTGEITIYKNVNAANMPQLWFSAKQVMDNLTWRSKVIFAMRWVNNLLNYR